MEKIKCQEKTAFLWKIRNFPLVQVQVLVGQEDFSFSGKSQKVFGKVDVQLSLGTLLKGKKCVCWGDHMCREVSY